MQEAASRAAARDAMRQNMEMMEAKRNAQALQKARDRNNAAVVVQTEDSWWNRGAASEKVQILHFQCIRAPPPAATGWASVQSLDTLRLNTRVQVIFC
jgi:hypothetical protein